MMFKTLNDQTPKYLANRFRYKNSKYDLRGYKIIDIPKPKTDIKKRSISYLGAKTWNSLPDSLKKACNLPDFKCRYFDDCNI